jgi:hypothetical protein
MSTNIKMLNILKTNLKSYMKFLSQGIFGFKKPSKGK